MNTYLVKLTVTHQDTRHQTEWVVEAATEQEAKALAFYKESHGLSEKEVTAQCLKTEHTEIIDANFSYKISDIIEMQAIKTLEPMQVILIPKNVALIDRLEDIVPINGMFFVQAVILDWLVDGVRKEIKIVMADRSIKGAITEAIINTCSGITYEQVNNMIHNRALYENINDSGSYALRSNSDMLMTDIEIDSNKDYLIRAPEHIGEVNKPVLAIWNLGF